MNLAVVGSTKLGDSALARAIIEYLYEFYKPDVVTSGGALGIDTLARDIARSQGIVVIEFLPKTNRWRDGFKPRNEKIAKACDMLARLALLDGRTYGSGWIRDRAAELGKPTVEFVIPPHDFYQRFAGFWTITNRTGDTRQVVSLFTESLKR